MVARFGPHMVLVLGMWLSTDVLVDVAPGPTGSLRKDPSSWEFHDLLFHARSRRGRHAYPSGRKSHQSAPTPGKQPEDLANSIPIRAGSGPDGLDVVIWERQSTRVWNERHPIGLAQLSEFLCRAGLVAGLERERRLVDRAPARLYPSAGGVYEIDVYLVVRRCTGLLPGLYRCSWIGRSLRPVASPSNDTAALLDDARLSLGAKLPPQILIVLAAHFNEISSHYASIAYSNVLKNAGVVMQQLYLVAGAMGLAGCAIGSGDSEVFARAAGTNWLNESSVGEFALGASPESVVA